MGDELPARIAMDPARNGGPPAVQPRTLPSWLAGLLGVLTAALAVPGVIVAGLGSAGLAVPPLLAGAAVVASALSPLVGAGAYWAAGGDPRDVLPRKQ